MYYRGTELQHGQGPNTGGFEPRRALGLAVVMLLALVGCKEPDEGEGQLITSILLPVDTVLDLHCPDVGINAETCVLNDPDNPYATAVINEFDQNNPDAETKFTLANELPPGPSGAKARFYLWATALARRPSGENQWHTARALHELWDANGDPLIQAQALKAYRSVLDNFFGSVTFFECCPEVSPDGTPVAFPATLNELVADNLFNAASTGWARLVPGDPLLTLSLLGEWGYTYDPEIMVLSVNEG